MNNSHIQLVPLLAFISSNTKKSHTAQKKAATGPLIIYEKIQIELIWNQKEL